MKKKISLVLSSGGARGIAHIGVIEELERQGYEIVSIAGASMGALVGGIYASGKLQEFHEWIVTLDRMAMIALIDLKLGSNGLIKGEKIINELKKIVPDRNIEDLNIPLAIVATDIKHNKEVHFLSGNLFEAIRSSISIPTVFTPVKKGDSILIDGGVLNPIPIDLIQKNGEEILIAVDVNAAISVEKPVHEDKDKDLEDKKYNYFHSIQQKMSNLLPKNKHDKMSYFNLITRTTNLMIHQISTCSLKLHKTDILINISKDTYSILDFYKAKEIIEVGVEATKKALDNYSNRL